MRSVLDSASRHVEIRARLISVVRLSVSVSVTRDGLHYIGQET